mgnify:CR=1 FL=1
MDSHWKPSKTTFRHFDLFNFFTDGEVEALIDCSMLKHYRRGHLICKQGETNKWIYFIISGALMYTRNVRDDSLDAEPHDVIIQLFGQGEAIGDATVFSEVPYRGNVRAAKDSALLAVDRVTLAKLSQTNCDALICLYTRTASKMFKIVEGVDVAYGKLLKRIDSLAQECANVGVDLYSHFSKTQIARLLGLSRVAVTNSMNGNKHIEKP